MCNFLSAIGMKNGDVICIPSETSHELLINFGKLKDDTVRNWARIEFIPEKIDDISTYKLKVDDTQFDWITDNLKEKWQRKLIAILKRIIITEDKDYLPVGEYILSGEIVIKNAGYATIINAGYSTIRSAGHSTIQNAGYSTIQNAGSSTIQDAWSSTIINKQNCKIL
jgi:hypothetical protein